jgi:hypothetical protein
MYPPKHPILLILVGNSARIPWNSCFRTFFCPFLFVFSIGTDLPAFFLYSKYFPALKFPVFFQGKIFLSARHWSEGCSILVFGRHLVRGKWCHIGCNYTCSLCLVSSTLLTMIAMISVESLISLPRSWCCPAFMDGDLAPAPLTSPKSKQMSQQKQVDHTNKQERKVQTTTT